MEVVEPCMMDLISGLLSSDTSVRTASEQKLLSYQNSDPDFCVHLVRFIKNVETSLALRQMCCVLLKQYVVNHWSTETNDIKRLQASQQAQEFLRSNLPQILSDNFRPIRTGVAYVIAAVARYDWPEKWPQLFEFLIEGLQSETNAVHGCMKVLAELAQDIRTNQVESVAPVIIPCLVNVVLEQMSFTNSTRKRALEVYRAFAASLFELNKSVAKGLLRPSVDPIAQCLLSGLEMVQSGTVDDLGMLSAAVKVLVFFAEKFPKLMAKGYPERLTTVTVELLERCTQHYCTETFSDSNETLALSNNDSDDESVSVDNVLYEICDLIQALSIQRQFDDVFLPKLTNIFNCILYLMQITVEKEQSWIETPSQFVADEDEEALTLDLRTGSKDMILNICEDHGESAMKCLCQAGQRHLAEAAEKRLNGQTSWWKQTEVVLISLAGQSETLMSCCNKLGEGDFHFSMPSFLTEHVFPSLEVSDAPILRAQALWFLGRIVNILPKEWKEKLVDLCTILLAPEQSILIRISAVRALYSVASNLEEENSLELIGGKLKQIITDLVKLALCSDETTISLVLSTITVCVKFQGNLHCAATMESRILPLLNACALKYSGDPVVTSEAADLLKIMASIPSCRQSAEQRLVPTVVSILEKDPDTSKMPLRLPAVSLELLCALIRGSGSPLGEKVVYEAFPMVINRMLKSNHDEPDLLAAGRECLRAYIVIGGEQIVKWKDDHGKTGAQLIIDVICHLLKPEMSSLTCNGMICRLIYCLMKTAADAVRPYLDKLLEAVLLKMISTEVNSVRQSMIVIWAYLINYDLEPVLTFLAVRSTPQECLTSSALEFMLRQWCLQHQTLIGAHNQKISCLGLSKLIEWSISHEESPLNNIVIICDNQPFFIKAFKLLLADYGRQLPTIESQAELDGNGSSGSTTPRGLQSQSSVLPDILADVLSGVANDFDSDEWSDGEETNNDAGDSLALLDIKDYLSNFLKSVSNVQTVAAYLSANLNEDEKRYLHIAMNSR